jgi:hypothetical protein
MEAEIKPKVLNTVNDLTKNYNNLMKSPAIKNFIKSSNIVAQRKSACLSGSSHTCPNSPIKKNIKSE